MVTGGAGFIACWFVRHLTLTYPDIYNVISFDKLDYCATLNNTRILDRNPNFTFSHVDLSFGNSYQFTNTNVYGTHVLLESARAHGVARFIHISTDEVYGDVPSDGDDLIESSLLAPTNPYSASKAAAGMLVNAYWKSFKLPVIIVRSNNAYGPHQFPEKIIPKFAMLLHRGNKLLLHGDGTPTRRYLYAGDIADALDTIFHRGAVGQIYNISSRDEVSNLDVCRKLLHIFGLLPSTNVDPSALQNGAITADRNATSRPSSDSTDAAATAAALAAWVEHTEDRPFNDQRYATDGAKLAALGWRQRTGFDEGLRATVSWYRRFGEAWWGDVGRVLTPFPVVARGNEIFTREEHEATIGEGEGEDEVGADEERVWTRKAWDDLQASGGTV